MKKLPKKTTVSLVLGSGGARGLAHIGVIGWLEEHGYEIRSIAGSSMGALVGGIYAAGELDVYRRWVSALDLVDVLRLLDFSFGGRGLIKGERLMGVLRDLIGDRAIESLPLSFTAVATDLDTGREVWLDRGSLFDAIRASIAIPTIFTPQEIGGRLLVDGGLVNPIPIAPTLRDLTDLTVAVNATAPVRGAPPAPEPEPAASSSDASGGTGGDGYRRRIAQFLAALGDLAAPRGPDLGLFDVISRSMDTMQSRIARFQLAAQAPDVLIEIPRDACQIHEFHRAGELVQVGKERTAQAFAGFRTPLRKKPAAGAA
ncbi:MAG: patatin-like phospholipase family protein [Thermodesulfobacteriota bacterium]